MFALFQNIELCYKIYSACIKIRNMVSNLKYKVISIDLDGTLLTPFFHTITCTDLAQIGKYSNYGGKVFINTGRSIHSTYRYLKLIEKTTKNLPSFVSCYNGAWIKDLSDNKIYQNLIEHEVAFKFYELAKKEKIQIWLYTPRCEQEAKVESNLLSYRYRFLIWIARLTKLTKIKDINNLSSYKINFLSFSKKKIKNFFVLLKKLNFDRMCTICLTNFNLIEVTPLNINKAYAINFICKKYNIQPINTIAIGDSFNDVSAFKLVGLAIGVKPRNKMLYQYCNQIVSYKRSAVAFVINRYGFIEKNDK